MPALTTFIAMGFLSLIWQTYSDLKHKEIDSRRNWMMYGALLAIVLIGRLNFWFYLGAIVIAVIYTRFIRKMFADGDLEALRWVVPGFLVINWALGLAYLIVFGLLTVIYVVFRRMLKIRGNTAGFTLILGAFAIVSALALNI